MQNQELLKVLTEIQAEMKRNNHFSELEESGIINEIILPIITLLDWKNIIREHHCDYGFIDILLLNKKNPKTVVEAKRADQNLEDHKEQLYGYLEGTNAKLGILTNGYVWEFYLPKFHDKWRMKKFYELNIKNNPIILHDKFMDFLSFDKVISPNYSRIARKNIQINDFDDSLMGISDVVLIERIERHRSKLPKLTPNEKNILFDLELEAMYRDLPDIYWG